MILRYGLGLIYERTNKLRHAEYHFRRALSINPYNIIMLCCLGTIIEKRTARKSAEERKVGLEKALKVFEGALRIDGKSGMAGFRRVRCLVGLKRYQVGLGFLPRFRFCLSRSVPKEKLTRDLVNRYRKPLIPFSLSPKLSPLKLPFISFSVNSITDLDPKNSPPSPSPKQST